MFPSKKAAAPPPQDQFQRQNPEWLLYEFNTLEDPSLLDKAGQLRAAREVLAHLQENPELLNQPVKIALVLPNEDWVQRVEEKVAQYNQIAQPNSLWEHAKLKGLRAYTGLQGNLKPVSYKREISAPNPTLQILADISGFNTKDIDQLSALVQQKTVLPKQQSSP